MTILVTGGAGYIGSKFAYDAISKGNKIIIVDNLTTGSKKLIPKKAIFYKCNISNQKKIDFILKKHRIKNIVPVQNWIILSILSGIFVSGKDVFTKYALVSKNSNMFNFIFL